MLVVVALGGNALAGRSDPGPVPEQARAAHRAARALVPLARRHRLVVTHGNGPQVGMLALAAAAAGRPEPLDVLDAETEGLIGYLLEQALHDADPGLEVATLLTQVVVDADDPAFAAPAKPIGPAYLPADGARLAAERGWAMAADGDRVRRVVASPEPRDIVELRTIRRLVDAGVTVVCAGGGGVPVVVGADHALRGVEAVVDKDLASALVAQRLGADALVVLTDVAGVLDGRCGPRPLLWRTLYAAAVPALGLPAGSMGPKAEACRRFVTATGGFAAIGALADAAAVLAGTAGTRILPGDGPGRHWEA